MADNAADSGHPPRARKAAGPDRPTYFGAADSDRIMSIVLALVTEVAALRERVDTHERLAAAGSLPALPQVEAFVAAPADEQAREAWRDAYIRRLFRVVTEDLEALRDPPAS